MLSKCVSRLNNCLDYLKTLLRNEVCLVSSLTILSLSSVSVWELLLLLLLSLFGSVTPFCTSWPKRESACHTATRHPKMETYVQNKYVLYILIYYVYYVHNTHIIYICIHIYTYYILCAYKYYVSTATRPAESMDRRCQNRSNWRMCRESTVITIVNIQ